MGRVHGATRKPFSPFQNPMFRFPYEPSIPSTEEDPSMEPTLPTIGPTMGAYPRPTMGQLGDHTIPLLMDMTTTTITTITGITTHITRHTITSLPCPITSLPCPTTHQCPTFLPCDPLNFCLTSSQETTDWA